MTVSLIAGAMGAGVDQRSVNRATQSELQQTEVAIRSVARTVATLNLKPAGERDDALKRVDDALNRSRASATTSLSAETTITAQSARPAPAGSLAKAYAAAATALKSAILLRLA